jgi:hypothetical protein
MSENRITGAARVSRHASPCDPRPLRVNEPIVALEFAAAFGPILKWTKRRANGLRRALTHFRHTRRGVFVFQN